MNQTRTLLYVALIAILFFLWEAWQKDYPTNAPVTTTPTAESAGNLPPLSAQTQAAAMPPSGSQTPAANATTTIAPQPHIVIPVDTDVLHAEIDTQGGNLIKLTLNQYPQSLDQKPRQPVVLLNNDANTLHIAQSGLIGKLGPDTETGQATYKSTQTRYSLGADQNSLDVKLSWRNEQGITINKIFTFQRGKYDIGVSYQIDNQSPQTWSGQLYAQLRQNPIPSSSGFFGLHTYQGAAISSSEKYYEQISFSNMEKANLDRSIAGGWLALQQRYFLSAWIADPAQTNRYYTRFDPANHIYTLGYVGPTLNVAAGQTATTKTTFYAGPEIGDVLKKIAPHLDLTIDYGWLSPISQIIFVVMKYIHKVIGNWGWSIVLVTLLIKLVFYHLSATSYRSMAKMRKLTPQLQALKERFGDDRQKMGQATMELYKREKANPLTGCLPMIVQIPFFIALYYVLIESVELRQAPFIFWIHDLSIRDPYFVLPILMGISMFVQQRLNPTPPDPVQAKVMMFLPVIFTVFFAVFPAGLVLYWLVNNCVGALQQWYITRQVEGKKR